MSKNPYESPTDVPDASEYQDPASLLRDEQPAFFRGGWPAVIGVGVIGGLGAMSFLLFSGNGPEIINPFVFIFVVWLLAMVATVWLLRGHGVTGNAQVVSAVIAMPICYVLYIPICSFGSMAVSGGSYNVDESVAVISSVVVFTFLLWTAAWMIRGRMRRSANKRSYASDSEQIV